MTSRSVFGVFLPACPWRTAATLLALVLAAAAEGIGISSLLPLLDTAAGGPAAPADPLRRSLDAVLDGLGLEPGIGVLLALLIAGLSLRNLLLLLAQRQSGYLAARVATDLRRRLLRALMRSRWPYFLEQPAGRLGNALLGEAGRAAQAFVNGTAAAALGIQALACAALAFALSWRASLAGVTAAVLVLAVFRGLVRMARRAGRDRTRLTSALAARLTDTLVSVKPLKAMDRDRHADGLLRADTRRLNRAVQRQVLSTAGLGAAGESLSVAVLALGIYLASGRFGMPLPTVTMLALLLGRMLTQFRRMQQQMQRVAADDSAFRSLWHSIRTAEQAREAMAAGATPTLSRDIRLADLRFGWNGRPLLDGLSLEIPAHALTVLGGASGAGKTTVVDLITGLLQPEGGSILVDGVALPAIDRAAWRRRIGYVAQDTHLLHDSVLHNVTLGDASLSEADAWRALREAGAASFVAALADGLHSPVGEGGGRLSGGQRQRILIARALVHRPLLLILDEATRSLDPATEADLCRTLLALRRQLTLLAIAHRGPLIDAADRVYRIENGRARFLQRDDRDRAAARAGSAIAT